MAKAIKLALIIMVRTLSHLSYRAFPKRRGPLAGWSGVTTGSLPTWAGGILSVARGPGQINRTCTRLHNSAAAG